MNISANYLSKTLSILDVYSVTKTAPNTFEIGFDSDDSSEWLNLYTLRAAKAGFILSEVDYRFDETGLTKFVTVKISRPHKCDKCAGISSHKNDFVVLAGAGVLCVDCMWGYDSMDFTALMKEIEKGNALSTVEFAGAAKSLVSNFRTFETIDNATLDTFKTLAKHGKALAIRDAMSDFVFAYEGSFCPV